MALQTYSAQKKMVAIVVAASGENREVLIRPGQTVRDTLEAARLPGYVLSSAAGDRLFVSEEDLFAAIEDGARLYASSPAQAGVAWGGVESDSVPSSRM